MKRHLSAWSSETTNIFLGQIILVSYGIHHLGTKKWDETTLCACGMFCSPMSMQIKPWERGEDVLFHLLVEDIKKIQMF